MDADNLHRRLKKIIGQLGAIDKMVDQDVPCEDMLMQINAAKSALHKVGQVVLEGHLNHCVRRASPSTPTSGSSRNFPWGESENCTYSGAISLPRAAS